MRCFLCLGSTQNGFSERIDSLVPQKYPLVEVKLRNAYRQHTKLSIFEEKKKHKIYSIFNLTYSSNVWLSLIK